MTREEASTIIGNIPVMGDECYTISEYQQAKSMAIEALEDILEMSVAIDTITYTEGYTYGFDNELKMALKWIEREGK